MTTTHRSALVLALFTTMTLTAAAGAVQYGLTEIGRYESGIFAQGAAEIVAYDPISQQLFVVNGNTAAPTIDVLDFTDPTSVTYLSSLALPPGTSANSVAVKNGVVAVALADASDRTNPGQVAFYNAATGAQLGASVAVGSLPDMITFTPDGTKVLVANEGESSATSGGPNPDGSVSIISVDITGGPATFSVGTNTTATFTSFNPTLDPADSVKDSVRIHPNAAANPAQDIEPEYITVSADSATAYVTLQENNAIAVVDVASGTITQLLPLGVKDYTVGDNKLDPSDRDTGVNINNWPVYGMYMPDTVSIYEVGGKTYLITANEGDTRGEVGDTDYPGFEDESRFRAASGSGGIYDSSDIAGLSTLRDNANLGRLVISTIDGNTDADPLLEEIYTFGGRSFSIWDVTDPNAFVQVYDSGDDFEQITADLFADFFNSDNEENNFDNRSDNKGPEPEALTIGIAFGRVFAFIGLERVGGVMVYDITDPTAPVFMSYFTNRDFFDDPAAGTAGDLGPEGFYYISALDSPTGDPLLLVANEISGTTTVLRLSEVPEPATAALTVLALTGLGLTTRRRRA